MGERIYECVTLEREWLQATGERILERTRKNRSDIFEFILSLGYKN